MMYCESGSPTISPKNTKKKTLMRKAISECVLLMSSSSCWNSFSGKSDLKIMCAFASIMPAKKIAIAPLEPINSAKAKRRMKTLNVAV